LKNKNQIRVAVFEDSPIMLDAYRSILDGSPGYACSGAFNSCNNWKLDIRKSNPDVVMMDIEMAGLNGIAATRLIKQEFPGIRVLIQTVFEDEQKIFSALCAGANGYIVKNISPVKMLEAIADVYNGGSVMSPGVCSRVIGLMQRYAPELSTSANNYELTQRETEILSLMSTGLPLPRVAEKLFLGYETVRSYVKSIYQKLHVTSATEAVVKAIRENLV